MSNLQSTMGPCIDFVLVVRERNHGLVPVSRKRLFRFSVQDDAVSDGLSRKDYWMSMSKLCGWTVEAARMKTRLN